MRPYTTPNTVTTCLEAYVRRLPDRPGQLFTGIMCLWGAVIVLTSIVLMWVL